VVLTANQPKDMDKNEQYKENTRLDKAKQLIIQHIKSYKSLSPLMTLSAEMR